MAKVKAVEVSRRDSHPFNHDSWIEPIRSDLARFVKQTRLDIETGCIEWTGATNRQGYGQFFFNGKRVMAHRFSYAVKNIKDVEFSHFNSLNVCHSCENPKCVNPSHAFLGAHKVNAIDYGMAVRQSRGKLKHRPIDDLKAEEVLEIRAALKRKEPIEMVATRHMLTPSQANLVFTSDDWPWLK